MRGREPLPLAEKAQHKTDMRNEMWPSPSWAPPHQEGSRGQGGGAVPACVALLQTSPWVHTLNSDYTIVTKWPQALSLLHGLVHKSQAPQWTWANTTVLPLHTRTHARFKVHEAISIFPWPPWLKNCKGGTWDQEEPGKRTLTDPKSWGPICTTEMPWDVSRESAALHLLPPSNSKLKTHSAVGRGSESVQATSQHPLHHCCLRELWAEDRGAAEAVTDQGCVRSFTVN